VKVFVCGDSFCVSDPEWGPNWVDMLSQRFDVTCLAEVSATNLLIARQVDQAIAQGADFVILQCTSCTRAEKRHGDRLVPFSYHTAGTETTPFDAEDLRVLREYFARFFDMELAIYQNRITIEHTLQQLVSSGISFLFDQGGFEHPGFGSVGTGYFDVYRQHRSEINLWSYPRARGFRPYYHITDPEIHKKVADYYTREITTCAKY